MNGKVILDLCGGTGAWSKPYQDNGYDVRVVTLPGDVRLFKWLEGPIYGVLAAPPCTHLAGSGARWWAEKGEGKLLEALSVVDACLRIILIANPVFWALENPIGRLTNYLGKPQMYFNPADYSDGYTKRTALWGRFNIPKPTYKPEFGDLSWKKSSMHLIPPSEDRAKLRSITPAGFAQAFYEANK